MLTMGVRSEEYDAVMFELVLSAVVPGERAARPRADLAVAQRFGRTEPQVGVAERSVLGLRVGVR
jgi:hypothetical protein